MRKVFGGLFALTMGAVLLIGTVFAWTTSNTATGSATVGTASLTVNYTANSNVLGPDGATVIVGSGDITNTGDFALTLAVTSDLSIDAVSVGGSCSVADFDGSVDINDAGPVAPTATGGAFDANIETLSSAPEDCQGKTVDYTVTIDATT